MEFTLSRLARYDEVRPFLLNLMMSSACHLGCSLIAHLELQGNPIGALLSMAPKPNTIFNKMKNLVGDSGSSTTTSGISSSGQRSPSGQQQQPLQQQNSGGGSAGAGNNSNAHLGQSYVHFMRASSEQLQQVVVDELWVNRLLEVGFFWGKSTIGLEMHVTEKGWMHPSIHLLPRIGTRVKCAWLVIGWRSGCSNRCHLTSWPACPSCSRSMDWSSLLCIILSVWMIQYWNHDNQRISSFIFILF